MKRILLTTLLLLSVTALADAQILDRTVYKNNYEYVDNWAIGVRAGEPLGINVRKYFREGTRAFDANIGTYGFLWGRNKTYGKERSGDRKQIYNGAGFMLQGIYNWHHTLTRNNAIHVYYGAGGQINQRRLYDPQRTTAAVRQVSLGPTANVGLEVKVPNSDLGVFVDGGGYVEILPHPFLTHLQVSGGLRLNLVR